MTTYPPGDWRNNPARTKEEKRLTLLSDQSVRLDAPAGHGFLSARLNAHLASNAYYDGANWQRYDTTAPAALWDVQGGVQFAALFTAPAGANPIVWNADTNFGADSGWQAAPYAANWSDYGGGQASGGYKKDALGWVRLKGLVKKAVALVALDTIFTLPIGYRPTLVQTFSVASSAGYTQVNVNPDGTVLIGAGGSAIWTSLAGVSFDPTT